MPLRRTRFELALTLLVFAQLACGLSADPALSTASAQHRIVNGTRAPQSTFLTEGEIQAVGYLAGLNGGEFCSGTLIRPRIVVTAEHCVGGRSAESTLFGFGVEPDAPDLLAPVARIRSHRTIDFAVLVLGVDPTEVLDPLTPIDINRQAMDREWRLREVDAAGFGDTRSSATGRFFASVEVVEWDAETVTVDGRGLRGICYGDSGGPILWQPNPETAPLVVGTEQWGDPSCVDRDHLTRLDVVAGFVDQVLAEPLPPAGEPCVGVDARGICDGEVVRWCEAGYLRSEDCSAQGLSCGWLGHQLGFRCMPASCGDTDYFGRCEEDTVYWCQPDGLATRSCDAPGSDCEWLSDVAGYGCSDCSRCRGRCVDLQRSLENCGACGEACAPAHASGICLAGQCEVQACDLDWADADGDADNGCEKLLLRDGIYEHEQLSGGMCAAVPGQSAVASLALLLIFAIPRRSGVRGRCA